MMHHHHRITFTHTYMYICIYSFCLYHQHFLIFWKVSFILRTFPPVGFVKLWPGDPSCTFSDPLMLLLAVTFASFVLKKCIHTLLCDTTAFLYSLLAVVVLVFFFVFSSWTIFAVLSCLLRDVFSCSQVQSWLLSSHCRRVDRKGRPILQYIKRPSLALKYFFASPGFGGLRRLVEEEAEGEMREFRSSYKVRTHEKHETWFFFSKQLCFLCLSCDLHCNLPPNGFTNLSGSCLLF